MLVRLFVVVVVFVLIFTETYPVIVYFLVFFPNESPGMCGCFDAFGHKLAHCIRLHYWFQWRIQSLGNSLGPKHKRIVCVERWRVEMLLKTTGCQRQRSDYLQSGVRLESHYITQQCLHSGCCHWWNLTQNAFFVIVCACVCVVYLTLVCLLNWDLASVWSRPLWLAIFVSIASG